MPEIGANSGAVRLCTICGDDLPPGGTRRIGICVWCVADEENKLITKIPGPNYGRDRNDSDDSSWQ